MRRAVRAAVLCVLGLALLVAPAGSATPSVEQQYRPLNDRIQAIGEDAGASLSAMSAWTYARRSREFAALASRTTAVARAVGAIRGSHGAFLAQQRELARALAKAAVDLGAISEADRHLSDRMEQAATKALLRDSPPINALRGALARRVGLA